MRFLVFIVFQIFTLLSFSQNSDIEKLKRNLLNSHTDSAKIAGCYLIAKEYLYEKNSDSAQKYANLGLKISQDNNLLFGEIEFYDIQGVIARNSSRYGLALEWHHKALELAESNNFKTLMAIIQNNIGVVYRRLDEYEKAIDFHLKALKSGEALNDNNIIPIALNGLGNSYSALNNYKEALKYFEKALKIQLLKKNSLGIAINYNNIGEAKYKLNQIEEALLFFQKSIEINIQLNNYRGVAINYSSFGDVYKKQKQYPKALDFYLKALEIDIKLKDYFYVASSHINLGETYFLMGLKTEAIEQINEGFKIAKNIRSKILSKLACEKFTDIFIQLNDYKNAFFYSQLATVYKDSIINENNNRNIANIQAVFNTEKKDRELKIIQKEQEKKQLLMIAVLISIIVVISIVVASIVIKQNNIKRKLNRELEEKNSEIKKTNQQLIEEINEKKLAEEKLKKLLYEKEVLFAEIHHRVKNNLAIISGMLQLQGIHSLDEQAKVILFDSQSRIQSMALIHEKIYQSEMNAQIEFSSYICDLCNKIKNTFHKTNVQIEIEIIAEKTFVDLNIAIPCGMLLNELITNAFKHAFINRTKGKILIEFAKKDIYYLKVVDDGVGINKEYASKTLGMKLINTFVKQLHGKMQIENNNGTGFYINFNPPKMKVWK